MIIKRTGLFSEKKGHKRVKKSLEEIESHRGRGRAIISAPFTAGGSLVGGYVGRKAANEADAEGLSDDAILSAARKKGAGAGAITAAGVAGISHALGAFSKGARKNPAKYAGKSLRNTAIATGLGALGGMSGAGVNTKTRIAKRALKERELNDLLEKLEEEEGEN